MRIFLTMKHWQLFVLLVGVPLFLEFFMIGFYLLSRTEFIFLTVIPVMIVLTVTVHYTWLYSLGTKLADKLPPTQKMSLTPFTIFLFIPVVYICLFILCMFWYLNNW